jgi:hypothetical protein
VAIRPKIKKGRGRAVPKASAPKKGVAKVEKVIAWRRPVSPCPSDDYDEDYVEFLKTYKPCDGYSSGSDEIDADYAEFLKTCDPQEFYPGVSPSDEGKVKHKGVSKEKEVSDPSKTTADLDYSSLLAFLTSIGGSLVVFCFDHVLRFLLTYFCAAFDAFIMNILFDFDSCSCMVAPYLPNFSLSVMFCDNDFV